MKKIVLSAGILLAISGSALAEAGADSCSRNR